MTNQLERIEQYYSSAKSMDPDVAEDIGWLIKRVKELESAMQGNAVTAGDRIRELGSENKRYQETMTCKYPDCKHEAMHTFSLVPLCQDHYELIWYETEMYYKSRRNDRMKHTDREHYHKIAHLIPWGINKEADIECAANEWFL